ncbi:MAG: TonB-dependent receptor [Desulfuromonas thiophila]|nr:TonB-dependent receptor [Desulfuromonas thiophila]
MRLWSKAAPLALLVGLAGGAAAGTAAAEQTLEDLVVTATRSTSAVQQVGGASVAVISAADIAASQVQTVAEALRLVPGVNLSPLGGLGTTTKVFLRGADSKNTLVLLDGVVVNDPTDTNRGADLANLSLDNIERIEVVKGPMSVLYGSNASAGVINIITRQATDQTQGSLSAEAGSYHSRKVAGDVRGTVGPLGYSLALSHLDSEGYSLANADNNAIAQGGNTSEDDGWRNTSFSGKVNAQLCSSTALTALVHYSDAQMDLDDWGAGYAGDRFALDWTTWQYQPDPTGRTHSRIDSERLFGRVNLHSVLLAGRLLSDVDFSQARQQRDAYDNDGQPFYDYLGETREWRWQGQYQLGGGHSLTGGIGHQTETADSSAQSKEDATTLSAWLQHQWLWHGVDLVSGVRLDDHDRFGSKYSWRLAPAYRIAATGTTLRASYAVGLRAPSLYELYSEYGNRDLDPEKSRGLELGIDQLLLDERLQLSASWFRLRFKDRIDWDYSRVIAGNPWPGGYNQLAGESESEGVELGLRYRPAALWQLVLDYSYTDTRDPDGRRLVRRPLQQVHAGLRYQPLTALCLQLDGYWYDERDAIGSARDVNGQPVTTLDDYVLVNLAASYQLTKVVELYGRVDNLFDEDYEEAWSYATPGQSFYGGARLRF